MRILITGGTGFIGTHLVNGLLRKYHGSLIEVVDDLSSSTLEQGRKKFFEKNNIHFHETTVEEFYVPSNIKYDQIYHLACRVGPAHVPKYMGRMGSEITMDAMKMADLAIHCEAPLISVSTSEVYGKDPQGIAQKESTPLEVPADCTARLEYTIAKLMTEISLINLAKVSPLRVNLIRPFNIVGPLQTKEGGFVLPRFVEAALKNEPLTVFGDGSQMRAFTHVSDLVRSLIMIMESDVNQKIYNVGTPENTCRIKHLARRTIMLINSQSEIQHIDPKRIFGSDYSDAPSKIPDISLIREDIGWQPTWPLDLIIANYAEYLTKATQKIVRIA